MAIPLILAAVGRVAAGTAVRGAAAGRVAGSVARIKPAMTAPSGTVPGVVGKQGIGGATKRVIAAKIARHTTSGNGQQRMTPLSGVTASGMTRDTISSQISHLLTMMRQNNNSPDNTTSTKCCEAGNAILSSIDETLKKMLSIQQHLVAGARETAAEAKDKPAPGFGGWKEKAKEAEASFWDALGMVVTGWALTNLKPIGEFVANAANELGKIAGNLTQQASDAWSALTKEAGNAWDNLTKDAGDAWNAAKQGLTDWWNGATTEWDKFWADKNSAEIPPTAPQAPTTPAPMADSRPKQIGNSIGSAGVGLTSSTPTVTAPKPAEPSVSAATPRAPTTTMGGPQGDLRRALEAQGITDPRAIANIMAQVQAESGFKPQSEISYRNTSNKRIREIFGSKVKNLSEDELTRLKSDDAAFFDKVYGDIKGLGNTQPGDAYRYRGRGYIQLTGRANYAKIGKMIGEDLISNPDLVNNPAIAAKAAAAYFKDKQSGGVDLRDSDAVTTAVGPRDRNAKSDRAVLAAGFLQTSPSKAKEINGNAIEMAGSAKTAPTSPSVPPVIVQTAAAPKSPVPQQVVASVDGPRLMLRFEQFSPA